MSTLRANQIQTTTGKPILNSTGSILQVVSTTKTDTFTTTSTSYTDVTGLTVNITPTSSSSKILITANISSSQRSGAYSAWYRVSRNGTGLSNVGDAAGSRQRGSTGGFSDYYGYAIWPYNLTYLDSPASTSTLTYTIQALDPYATGIYVNMGYVDQNVTFYGRTTSTITVFEVT
jgi:hypothetical protein